MSSKAYKLPLEVRKYKAEQQAKWRAKKNQTNAAILTQNPNMSGEGKA